MAYKVGGTEVISNARALNNITAIDSTTATTISTAVGSTPETLTAWNEIVFMNTPTRQTGTDIYYSGSNCTPSDSSLYVTEDVFGKDQWAGFTISTFGGPNSNATSPNVAWYSNNPITNLWDGGIYTYGNAVSGSYASNFNATSTLTVTYTYSSSKTCSAFYYGQFSAYKFSNITVEAYVNSAWTQMDTFTPDGNEWRLFDPKTSTQFRWTATNPTINFVFYEMQFAGSTAASGKYVTTPSNSVSSAGSSVTAYAVVEGTNSGWTFQVSRDGGSNYASPSTSTATQYGNYYVYKLTYNLSSQTSNSTLGMKVTFPSNTDAKFYGCKIEG